MGLIRSNLIFLFFPFVFRAVLMAHGSSQARGGIGAAAAGLHHRHRDLSRVCDLHHSSGQCRIPSPLSRARDQTHILVDASPVH